MFSNIEMGSFANWFNIDNTFELLTPINFILNPNLT